MLSDSHEVRQWMIDGQLTPNQIVDSALLTAMKLVPREFFVPMDFVGSAYIDEEIPLGHGRMLMKPLVLARLAQALALRGAERTLIIGGATGYSAAVIAHLVAEVTMVEEQPELIAQARATLPLLNLRNVELIESPLIKPRVTGHFDAILIEGAVQQIPQPIHNLLKGSGGRLAYVENRALRSDGLKGAATGLGTIKIFVKHGSSLSTAALTEAGVTLLPGFATPAAFHFG